MWVYISIFWSGLLAATILPLSSEAALITFLLKGYSPAKLWLFATAGNTFGSCINWWIGRFINRLQLRHHRLFPFNDKQIRRAEQRFQRFGFWSVLFAWLPVVGDVLTFVAGALRMPFLLFLVLVGIGKGTRYSILIYLTLSAQNLTV